MKYFISIILLLSICLTSLSQNNKPVLKATDLYDPGMRLLYIGMANTIKIENSNDTNIFLRIANGPAEIAGIKGKFEYSIYVRSGFNKTTINILKKSQADTILLDTANYTILRVPDPVALFGNLIDTEATVNALMLQKEIKIFAPCYYQLYWLVFNFTLSVLRAEGTYESIETTGNLITKQQQRLVESLKPGDTLLIEEIKCKSPFGCPRSLSPIKIKVKSR